MKRIGKYALTVMLALMLVALSFGFGACSEKTPVGYVRDFITTNTPSSLSGVVYAEADGTLANASAANVSTSISGGTVAALTITTGTVTTLTSTNGKITTANITTLAAPSGGSLTITSPSISSPTITGTPVIANHAVGSTSYTAGSTSKVITHGMSGTPTLIFLTPVAGMLGTSASATATNGLFWTTANTTSFTIGTAVATNTTRTVDWIAFIADE
jgi:hypothetical protein